MTDPRNEPVEAAFSYGMETTQPTAGSRRVPLVSVVIPTKDRKEFLREALASARALEGDDLRIEIIVADNCSSEDMSVVAAEFGAKFVTTTQPGCGATRNAGYPLTTGDYVCFLDDDDVFLPGHLRPQIAFLEAHPDYAGCVGQVQLADFHLNPIGVPFPTTMKEGGDLFAAFFRENPQVGATVVRDWVREKVGMFDGSLLSSEDSDWSLRIAKKFKMGFVPEPGILFRQRPMATHDELQWMRLGLDTHVLIRNYRRGGKHRPKPTSAFRTLLRCRGGFYWYFTQSALTHSREGDKRSMYRSFFRALRSSPLHALNDLPRQSSFRTLVGHIIRRSPADPTALSHAATEHNPQASD